MFKKLIVIALLSSLCTATFAHEDIKVCAKYYKGKDHSWSQMHKASAQYLTGTELKKLLSKGAFDPGSHYVYIPRKNGRKTVINVGNSWSGANDGEFKDVRGHKWIIRKGWNNCK